MTTETQQVKPTRKARTKWSKEKVSEVASRFTNKSVFHKEEQSAYQAARRLGVLQEVCSHMKEETRGRKPKKVAVVQNEAPQVTEQENKEEVAVSY